MYSTQLTLEEKLFCRPIVFKKTESLSIALIFNTYLVCADREKLRKMKLRGRISNDIGWLNFDIRN
jgi:hypothetical protein